MDAKQSIMIYINMGYSNSYLVSFPDLEFDNALQTVLTKSGALEKKWIKQSSLAYTFLA